MSYFVFYCCVSYLVYVRLQRLGKRVLTSLLLSTCRYQVQSHTIHHLKRLLFLHQKKLHVRVIVSFYPSDYDVIFMDMGIMLVEKPIT